MVNCIQGAAVFEKHYEMGSETAREGRAFREEHDPPFARRSSIGRCRNYRNGVGAPSGAASTEFRRAEYPWQATIGEHTGSQRANSDEGTAAGSQWIM